jgi:hypothetical protein
MEIIVTYTTLTNDQSTKRDKNNIFNMKSSFTTVTSVGFKKNIIQIAGWEE